MVASEDEQHTDLVADEAPAGPWDVLLVRARALAQWAARVPPAWWYAALAAGGALVGAGLTLHGVWAGTDSAAYVSVARNLQAGRGPTSEFFTAIDAVSFDDGVRLVGRAPLLLWPPGYPWLLATTADLTGGSVEGAARLVAIGSFATLAATTGALTRRLASGRWGAAVTAAALVTLYPWLTWFGSGIYSDLPFLALSGVAVLLLLGFARHRSPVWLVAFSVVAAAASLVRYVGVGLPLAAVLVVLTTRAASPRWRWWSIAGAAASVLPLLGWMLVRSQGLAYHAHEVRAHLPTDQLGDVAGAFGSWFHPEGLTGPLAWLTVASLVALGVLVGARVVLRRLSRARGGPGFETLVEPTAARVTLAVVMAYLVALLLASATVGERGTLDVRITLPLLPPVMALVVAAVWRLLRRPQVAAGPGPDPDLRWAGVVPIALVSVFLAVTLVAEAGARPSVPAQPLRGDELGLGSPALRAAIEPYPLVVSSSPSTIYGLTGRPSAPLPLLTRPSTGEPNPDHDREMDALHDLVQRRQAVVAYVLFDAVLDPSSLPTPEEVSRRVGAGTLETIDGVSIIGLP